MSDLLKRFAEIARANLHSIEGKSLLDGLLDAATPPRPEESTERPEEIWSDFWKQERNRQEESSSGPTRAKSQVEEDLAIFGLTPPSSLEEVRNARNREVKKYHSDRFVREPEKLEAANEIMQIYNNAFARLKKHYASS